MEWQFGNVRTHYDPGQWTAPFRCEPIGLDGRLTFGLINGRLECVGVEFHAARPIASADLRIPWREGIAAAAKLIVATAEWQRAYVGVVNEAGEYLRPPLGLSAPEWDAVRASAATPGEVSECEPVEVPDPCSPPCGHRHFAPGPVTVRLSAGGTSLAPMAPGAADMAELVSERIEQARTAGEPDGPKRGRRSLGLAHYQEVAHVYREAYRANRYDPTGEVARHFRIPPTTAARRVVVARRLGCLGPAKPRRAGEMAPAAAGTSAPRRGRPTGRTSAGS